MENLTTPYVLRTGGKSPPDLFLGLNFGDHCLIDLLPGQRAKIRKESKDQLQSVTRMENAVYMGRFPGNSKTLIFLVANGKFMTRSTFVRLPNTIPFNWVPKLVLATHVPNVEKICY